MNPGTATSLIVGIGALVWLAASASQTPATPGSGPFYSVKLPDGTITQGRNPVGRGDASITGERLYIMHVLYAGRWLSGIRVGDTQITPKPGSEQAQRAEVEYAAREINP